VGKLYASTSGSRRGERSIGWAQHWREIDWLGTTLASTGVRAVQSSDNPDADELCLITDLAVRHDASEIVTRVYPVSRDGIGLQLTDRSEPTGYTLDAANNYIEHDAGVAAYGRIERVMRFDDVSMQYSDSYLILPTLAANALFDCTVEYLRTHAVEQAYYALSVTDVSVALSPGETIDVIYHDYVDGQHVVNIDDTLTILAATTRIDNDGVTTVALDVATVDRQPQTEAGVIVDLVKRKDRTVSGAVTAAATPESEAITYQAGVDLILDGTTFHRAGNRVLLFSGDGTQLAQFDADDDGLTAALAAMSNGDVVKLPPCSISGDHVVPAGGALVGCSRENSILTGQVTLSDGAVLENLSIVRSVNNADDVYGVLLPTTGGTGYIYNCTISVTQAGAGKGIGILAFGRGFLGTSETEPGLVNCYVYGSTQDIV